MRNAKDAALTMKVSANSRAERESKMLENAVVDPDGAGAAQPAVIGRERAFGQNCPGLSKENDCAIHANNFAEDQEELSEERRGIESMSEHARKAP